MDIGEENSVKCVYKATTGKPCPTCGLTRSFYYILKGDLETSQMFFEKGVFIFSFFILHLFLRIIGIVLSLKQYQITKKFIIFDIVISILSFFYYMFVIYV